MLAGDALLRGPRLVAAARELLAVAPAGLLCDVDGTLSPIAPRPELAVVRPPMRRALRALVPRLALVAAVSGRAATDARHLVRVRGVLYVGNHGAEAVVGRRRWEHPEATRYRAAIAAVLETLRCLVPADEVRFEPKGVSASIHYRGARDPSATRAAILHALSVIPEARALRITEGRLIVELRPPIAASKGTATTCLLHRHELRAAVFLGDDRTDLDAMQALRAARDDARARTLSIAVASPEMPPQLLDTADGVVDGVDGVESFLTALASDLAS